MIYLLFADDAIAMPLKLNVCCDLYILCRLQILHLGCSLLLISVSLLTTFLLILPLRHCHRQRTGQYHFGTMTVCCDCLWIGKFADRARVSFVSILPNLNLFDVGAFSVRYSLIVLTVPLIPNRSIWCLADQKKMFRKD